MNIFHHMAIYLIPCSKSDSLDRFEESVSKKISLDRIYEFADVRICKELQNIYSNNEIPMWAFSSGNHSLWNQMVKEDHVLFIKYEKDEGSWVLFSKAEVSLKEENAQLAKDIWGLDKKTRLPWKYVFYLKNVEMIHIPIKPEELGYKERYNFPGTTRYSEFDSNFKVLIDKTNCNDMPEVIGALGLYEGAREQVSVNRYERNHEARIICLKSKGLNCTICGFNFGEIYGNMCEGYIHVHHIVPISDINEEYQINPETDLIPVCPNCHAAIHKFLAVNPNITIEQIQNQESVKRWSAFVKTYMNAR